jgi:hypothetical protein
MFFLTPNACHNWNELFFSFVDSSTLFFLFISPENVISCHLTLFFSLHLLPATKPAIIKYFYDQGWNSRCNISSNATF